ncbi:hypothetical protein EV182_007094, partial [Spiromyces aspiralis]
MSETTYELIYFPAIGIAEVIRQILSYSGANWKETNFTPDEWKEIKPTMPFERLPVLIERRPNGETLTLSESQPIERYLARKFGLISSDPDLAVQQEIVRDQFVDAQISLALWKNYNKDDFQERFETNAKVLSSRHEERLEKSEGDFYFGNEVSYPDIAAYCFFKFVKEREAIGEFAEEKNPRFHNLIKKLGQILEAKKQQ